ncbi:MAG TPA: hypothetical protein VF723_12225 [Pyrinomonadaceae bacterium]|jgi:hypothetical protein
MSRKGKTIRASEVGEYVFCARAWRLRLDGHAPTAGQHAREAGDRWHRAHGQSVTRAERLRRIAFILFLLALLLAAFCALAWWWR